MTPISAPVRAHQVAFDTGSFVRPVHRFGWEPVPVPAAGPPGVSGLRLLVVGADATLAGDVAAALRDLGAAADVCAPGHEPEPAAWDGIVDLNVTGQPYETGDTAWKSALERTVRVVQHRYADWRTEARVGRCCYLVVTEMGGRMGYDDAAVPQPLGGIWAGLAKCLPRELPNLAVKVIDVDRVAPVALARTVAGELCAADQFEVGYRDGVRCTLEARRRDTGPPRLALGPQDVVLVTGGARGVGFAFARGVAAETGCRVVVTGRSDLPDGQDWYTEDDEAYARRCRDRVASARTADQLRDIRAVQRRETELRSIRANLAAAGPSVSYERCDCADAEQVGALLRRIPAPAVIVHNAGIDEPRRLDEKSPAEVVRTVDVKVSGFGNLVAAVLAEPRLRDALKLLCNVGSLAGRLGGMIGQVDYSAGNEALARLGFWAATTHGLPVQTLCWPTWERLGVIANYDAAVRYVSTIAPDDGVRRWIGEITSAATGEVMFIGQIGTALVPSMLRGFWRFTGHPDLPRLHSLAHFLGELTEFELFAGLRTRVTYRAGTQPCLADFQVHGEPALPVSVLIEQACGLGDWVVPPGWPRQHLAEIRDVTVSLPGLRLAGATAFECLAAGVAGEDGWAVTVRITTGGRAVAAMTLVYRAEAPVLTDAVPVPVTRAAALPAGGLRWTGLALGVPEITGTAGGGWYARLPAVTAGDLWTVPFPPAPGITPAAVETAIRATAVTAGDLRIDRIVPCPGAQHVRELHGSPDGRDWLGVADGQPVLRLEGLTVR